MRRLRTVVAAPASCSVRFSIGQIASFIRAMAFVIVCVLSDMAFGQLNFEAEPINYHTARPHNRVQDLAGHIESGDKRLGYDDRYGYLKNVLEHLNVPISSQILVYSKTSFQPRKINPRQPRAVYFNDDVYVGWVQRGDVVEISAADPELGAVFYTLSQNESDHPKIIRDQGHCIVCHASSKTSDVPGHLVRSVFTTKSGQPEFSLGTFTTDYRSPFGERWGGWYVTGTHGDQRHLGNVVVSDDEHPEKLDVESGANVIDLSERLNTQPYLSSGSDIVALMVLEHQTRMHNLIARANMDTRSALHYDAIMNEALHRPADYRSDSTKRRIASTAEQLVECMLFVDEYRLTDVVKGTSGFAEDFTRRGPHDSKGRSLREFDLTTSMMKYPCSHLIYSESFDGLPEASKEAVLQRLFDILSGKYEAPRFTHLSESDRTAILDILRETKDNLPEYWQ